MFLLNATKAKLLFGRGGIPHSISSGWDVGRVATLPCATREGRFRLTTHCEVP